MRRHRALHYGFDPFGAGQPVRRGHRVTVHPWERGLLFRDGVLVEQLAPGSKRVWTSRSRLRTVDMRPRILPLPTQELPTADGIAIKVTAVAETLVVDPVTYLEASQDPDEALYLAVQIALREVIAATPVDSLLTARSELPAQLLAAVRGVDALGLQVERIEVKDVVLPNELKRAHAQAHIARAEGQAALERARGETAALRALSNAARLTAEHPTLFQLRLLQELSSGSGHTIVIGSEPTIRAATPPDAAS